MKLNRLETILMNNPLRAAVQRHMEMPWFQRHGHLANGGSVLEVGCGQGSGIGMIHDRFGASRVDAFDADRRMVRRAARQTAQRGYRGVLWVGSATAIPAAEAVYDAVFDFGVLHHVVSWRDALVEIYRVLRPGGVFFAYEILSGFITHPIWRCLLTHPQEDRFDHTGFLGALTQTGFHVAAEATGWNTFGIYVAHKNNPVHSDDLTQGDEYGIR